MDFILKNLTLDFFGKGKHKGWGKDRFKIEGSDSKVIPIDTIIGAALHCIFEAILKTAIRQNQFGHFLALVECEDIRTVQHASLTIAAIAVSPRNALSGTG
jgi:hypothetical protein